MYLFVRPPALSQYVLVLTLLILMQGGRLVTERRMVSDLYVFDLESFVWSRLPPHPDDDVPGARYFHSTDACESPYHFDLCPVRPSFMYRIGAGLLGYRSLVTKNAYTIRCLQTQRSWGASSLR